MRRTGDTERLPSFAGGLVFIGYALDTKRRAFDLRTGEVLWKTILPAAT